MNISEDFESFFFPFKFKICASYTKQTRSMNYEAMKFFCVAYNYMLYWMYNVQCAHYYEMVLSYYSGIVPPMYAPMCMYTTLNVIILELAYYI